MLEELRDFWPLTLRQLYYQLVARLVIENSLNQYKRLSALLATARLDGLVPWEALEDRSRMTLHSGGWANKREFVAHELDNLFVGYRRDLLQSQPHALELWIEKDALSRIVHEAAFPYCVPVIVARGFSSISYVNECRKRLERNAKMGKRTVILYFGDLDPSGWEMLPALLETLTGEMGLGDFVEGVRCALRPEQVEQYRLPRSPDAMKATDSRAKKFKEMLRASGYSDDLAVELDALPPETLARLVRESIERHLDMSLFKKECEKEEAERLELEEVKGRILRVARLL